MANTPINTKLLKVFVKEYTMTANVFIPALCELNSELQDAFNEVDATSKCGSFFMQGNQDNSFSLTLQHLEEGSYNPTTVFTAKEFKAAKDAGTILEILIADDADTPTIFAREFDVTILSTNSSFPEEGAATCAVEMRINGNIVDPL
jgi:hypothetical protein